LTRLHQLAINTRVPNKRPGAEVAPSVKGTDKIKIYYRNSSWIV
jgi:hypothetical protein